MLIIINRKYLVFEQILESTTLVDDAKSWTARLSLLARILINLMIFKIPQVRNLIGASLVNL